MASPLDLQFNEAILDIYRKAKTEAKYNAIRFLQMVTDHRGAEAAHILINSPTVSEGYTALWERGRLDLTVEAMVLENKQFQRNQRGHTYTLDNVDCVGVTPRRSDLARMYGVPVMLAVISPSFSCKLLPWRSCTTGQQSIC